MKAHGRLSEFTVNSDADPIIKRTDTTEDITNPELVDVAQKYVYELKGGGTVTINEANHMLTMGEDGPIFLGTFDRMISSPPNGKG